MPQNFLFPQRDQPLLMPVDMREWLPEDDLVYVVLDAVAALDLGGFRRRYRADGHGRAASGPGDDGRAAAVRLLPGRAVQPGDRKALHARCGLPGDLRRAAPRSRHHRPVPRPARAGAGTAHHVHRTIRNALNEAARRGHIAQNPVLLAKAPRVTEEETEPYTIGESGGFFRWRANGAMVPGGLWPWHLGYGRAKRSGSNGNM